MANDAKDDPTVARAWLSLLFTSTMRGHYTVAGGYALATRAAVERVDDDVLRAWLLNNLGILASEQGSPAQARLQLEQALELKQAMLGADHVDVGIAWLNLGGMLTNTGEHANAAQALVRARTIFETTVGEAHPLTSYALASQCHAEYGSGRTTEAIELCGRALARFAASRRDPSWESRTRFTLAEALWGAGREAEAHAMARLAAEVIEVEDPTRAALIRQWIETHVASTEPTP